MIPFRLQCLNGSGWTLKHQLHQIDHPHYFRTLIHYYLQCLYIEWSIEFSFQVFSLMIVLQSNFVLPLWDDCFFTGYEYYWFLKRLIRI
ncbi:MAG: hypothetical protein CM15mP88_1840 [Pseudomonadota bacterium]|nr:MAG: hypothetical protein CM15mP88_1840 [Pseudomonadota bacterium]